MKLEMILTTDAGDTARVEVENGQVILSAYALLNRPAMAVFQSMWHFGQGLTRVAPRSVEEIRAEVDAKIDDFAAQGSPMAQRAQRMRPDRFPEDK